MGIIRKLFRFGVFCIALWLVSSASGQDSTITVASWNLKNFGKTKLTDTTRIPIIVDVIKKYDVIAIQEVMDKTRGLPSILVSMVNGDSLNYRFIESLRVGEGRKESYVVIYDSDRVEYVPGTMGFIREIADEYAREPFYAMFRAGNFDFYLVTIHTDPDEVDTEIPALARDYSFFQDNTMDENDIILLGDFNARAPDSPHGSYTTLESFDTIPDIVYTIVDETNTRGGRSYDNIIFQSTHTAEYADSASVYTFWEDYGLTEDEGFRISDHKLVYVVFYVNMEDDD
jgi:hypothetical protein